MKNYKIVREEFWVSNGCDCCEPDDLGIYYVYRDGEVINEWNEWDKVFEPMSFSFQEDAIEFIFQQNGINVEYGVSSD